MRTVLVVIFAVLSAVAAQGQFTMQRSNTTADLRGIDNVGNGIAWASGTNGTVLRTEDGGYVWQGCSMPPGAEKLDFRGIQAFDTNTAIVMSSGPGDQSRLYKTTDGCHSWKLVFTNPDKDGFWDAIRSNGSELTVLGDPVAHRMTLFMMHLEDLSLIRPKLWYGAFPEKPQLQILDPEPDLERQAENEVKGLPSRLERNPKPLPKESFFAASNSSYIDLSQFSFAFAGGGSAEARAFVYDCQDFRRKAIHCEWRIRTVPIRHSDTAGVFSLAPNRSTQKNVLEPAGVVLIAVGGDYLRPSQSFGTAAYSTDLGRHWFPSQTPPHGYRSSVAYDPSIKTWITVGPNGTDISTDDGRNWRAVHPDPALHELPDADRDWNALSLPYVVGPHGRIGKLDVAALKR